MIKMILLCTFLSHSTGETMRHTFQSTITYDTVKECEMAIHTNETAARAQILYNEMLRLGVDIKDAQFECIDELNA